MQARAGAAKDHDLTLASLAGEHAADARAAASRSTRSGCAA